MAAIFTVTCLTSKALIEVIQAIIRRYADDLRQDGFSLKSGCYFLCDLEHTFEYV